MLRKILHTGVSVDNLEKSIELYKKIWFPGSER